MYYASTSINNILMHFAAGMCLVAVYQHTSQINTI